LRASGSRVPNAKQRHPPSGQFKKTHATCNPTSQWQRNQLVLLNKLAKILQPKRMGKTSHEKNNRDVRDGKMENKGPHLPVPLKGT
jgi:hypothetical protein